MSIHAHLHCDEGLKVKLSTILGDRCLTLDVKGDMVDIFATNDQLADLASVLMTDPDILSALGPKSIDRAHNAAVALAAADRGFRERLLFELRCLEDDERVQS